MEKTCIICKKTGELEEFIKDRACRFGRRNECYECKRKMSKEIMRNIRKRDSARIYRKYRIYCKKYPQKRRAHRLLNQAVLRGKIKKLPCTICGNAYKVHGHHPDYSEPLKVIWLCPVHHIRLHRSIKN